jgi:N-acetylglutamate synthase-like GNAT family acetyltransferase
MTAVMNHTAKYMTTVIVAQGDALSDMGPVGIRRASPADVPAALAMLRRCSRTTLFRRFHGYSDGVAFTRRTLQDPTNETFIAWHRSDCVAVATLAPDAKRGDHHLAILVEDAWQRRGVGSRLTARLVMAARQRGLATLHADIMNDDLFILRTLRRIGPVELTADIGTVGIDVHLTAADPRPTPSHPHPQGRHLHYHR